MNIIIVVTSLSKGINALTRLNNDGTYTILISNLLCQDKARKALLHELQHIKEKDFDSYLEASLIETLVSQRSQIEALDGINFYCKVV